MFGNGNRLPRQQGLVHLQLAIDQHRIGGDAVALMQHQQVTTHHIAPGDALLLAVADHQGTRRRQIAQGLQGTLRLAFLRQRDANDHEDKAQQEQGLGPVAQRQVDAPGGEKHEKHGLGEHIAHDGGRGFGGAAWQQVRAFRAQTGCGLAGTQPLQWGLVRG